MKPSSRKSRQNKKRFLRRPENRQNHLTAQYRIVCNQIVPQRASLFNYDENHIKLFTCKEQFTVCGPAGSRGHVTGLTENGLFQAAATPSGTRHVTPGSSWFFRHTVLIWGGKNGCVLVRASRRSEAPCLDTRQGELESVSAVVRDPDPTLGLHR